MKFNSIRILGLIAIVMLLAIPPVFAQGEDNLEPIDFKVTVTPDTATIGDEITVVIAASHDKSLEVSEPHVDPGDSPVMVKGDPTMKSKTSGDKKIDIYTTKLAAFKTGEIELPHFEFFYYDSLGNQNSRMAPIKSVFIKAIIAETAVTDSLKLRDIVGPKYLPVKWWLYVIGALVLIAVGFTVWYFWKRKVETVAVPETPPEPPFDIAIRQLNDLATKDLPGKGRFKLYYIELSNILRYYIEGRFEIKAVESTTYELRYILKHRDISRDQYKDILDFLSRSDMIKFARQMPPTEMPAQDFVFVKKFVTDTKPVVASIEQAEVAS